MKKSGEMAMQCGRLKQVNGWYPGLPKQRQQIPETVQKDNKQQTKGSGPGGAGCPEGEGKAWKQWTTQHCTSAIISPNLNEI